MNLRALLSSILFLSTLSSVPAADSALKVYILAGQSNMLGHARVSTFDAIGMDERTVPLLNEMRSSDRTPTVCEQVWISHLSTQGIKSGRLSAGFGADESKIGPEFTFGIYIQKFHNTPVLIIKTAWGGKSLHTDFRPPSAEPYRFREDQIDKFRKQGKDIEPIKKQKEEASGKYYRMTIKHVRSVLQNLEQVCPAYRKDSGYELAGFVWFQGWNDMVDRGTYPNRDKQGGYVEYSKLMAHFIRDVRNDLETPELPFVIGVMGVGGPIDSYNDSQQRYAPIHDSFRKAMAAPASLPEFEGNVEAVLTEKYWDVHLSELKNRQDTIRNQVKTLVSDGKIPKSSAQAEIDKMLSETFTEKERETLEKGISNQAYHYLGSAKILGQIGQAFAETMADLQR